MLGRLSQENLLQAQQHQQRLYNRGAKVRQFSPGDKVLVLLPSSNSKLLTKWQGPFVVTREWGTTNMKWYNQTGVESHKYITSTS